MTDQELLLKLCKIVIEYHNYLGEDERYPCRCKLCVAAKIRIKNNVKRITVLGR